MKAGTIQARFQLGGHIHIGLRGIDRGKLSNYISYYCGIPLRKIEKSEDILHRGMIVDNYGYFGRYYDKSYGIEWRMPASWLCSKEITTSALCLSYVAVREYEVNPEDIIILHSNTKILCW